MINQQKEVNAPQHDIDVQIIALALEKLTKKLQAKAINNRHGANNTLDPLYMWRRSVVEIARGLNMSPWNTLSTNQRNTLLQDLKPEDQERLGKPGAPAVPESLRNLPLKPPGRK